MITQTLAQIFHKLLLCCQDVIVCVTGDVHTSDVTSLTPESSEYKRARPQGLAITAEEKINV